jgi:hypothetical protein
VVSQIQSSEQLRLRVIGAQPTPTARPVTPTLEEAYLILMRGEAGSDQD